MKIQSALLVAVVAGAFAAPALSQEPVRANERYCLQSFDPQPAPLLCRFESMQQCLASRISGRDSCALNPVLAFRERR